MIRSAFSFGFRFIEFKEEAYVVGRYGIEETTKTLLGNEKGLKAAFLPFCRGCCYETSWVFWVLCLLCIHGIVKASSLGTLSFFFLYSMEYISGHLDNEKTKYQP